MSKKHRVKGISMKEDRRKISFVNREHLKVVNSREEFIRIKDSCNRHLSKYDLSNIDISNIDLHDFILEDVVFNYYDVEKKERKEIFNVNFMGCQMERVGFAQCIINRCNFDTYTIIKENKKSEKTEKIEHTTTLTECDFFFSELVNCRFKHTQIFVADFRYSSLTDCSMSYSHVKFGDFYMTAFHGSTNFTHSKYELCSITNATFDNHCLMMDNIDRLIQEDYDSYSKILINKENWSKHNPCASFSVLNEAENEQKELESRRYIAHEAFQIYTTLSGIYSGKGFFRDSNKAYAKAKDNEINFYKHQICIDWKDRKRWDWMKDVLRSCGPRVTKRLGYGFKIWPVFRILITVILVSWLLLWVYEKKNWDTSLAYSICNSFGPYFDHIEEVHHLCASFEPAIGILLVGFLGFVVANKIRNNS